MAIRLDNVLNRLQEMDELDRFDYLLCLSFQEFLPDEMLRKPENLFRECESNLWLDVSFSDGKPLMRCDSDASIVRVFARLLLQEISMYPETAVDTDWMESEYVAEILSPRTRRGLKRMVCHVSDMVKKYSEEMYL